MGNKNFFNTKVLGELDRSGGPGVTNCVTAHVQTGKPGIKNPFPTSVEQLSPLKMQRAAFSALKTPKGRAPSSIPHARFNSSSAPKNAQEKAQEAANKAVEQAKKYVNPETISSLQKSAGKLASKGVELLGPVGQRAGNLLGRTCNWLSSDA